MALGDVIQALVAAGSGLAPAGPPEDRAGPIGLDPAPAPDELLSSPLALSFLPSSLSADVSPPSSPMADPLSTSLFVDRLLSSVLASSFSSPLLSPSEVCLVLLLLHSLPLPLLLPIDLASLNDPATLFSSLPFPASLPHRLSPPSLPH